MSKILLISANTEKFPYPVPPLGLSIIASVLEKQHNVRFYDGIVGGGEELKKCIAEFQPDYIGISIRNIDDLVIDTTTYYVDGLVSDFVIPAREASRVPMILGGSGFSIYPEELMEITGAEYGISGEAEELFPLLIDCLDNGNDPMGLKNVYFRSGRKVRREKALFFDLAKLPFSEIDAKTDFTPYRNRGAYSIQTKRGCYHNCIYCSYPVIEGKKYRLRPAKEVVDEIEQAAGRLGNVTFEFVDSTFNDPPGHAEAICEEIIGRNLKLRLRTMGVNPANTSAKLFDLMLSAGFAQIDCTIDNASREMIGKLGKNFTFEQLVNTATLIREYNIPTMWFLIFGGPGETENTIAENFEFIDKYINPEDMVHITVGLRIYPQTRLCDIAIGEGYINRGDSLLKPVFYVTPKLGKERLDLILKREALKRPNCVPASESTPDAVMLKKTVEMQELLKLREPMFRTLLRVRRQMMENRKG